MADFADALIDILHQVLVSVCLIVKGPEVCIKRTFSSFFITAKMGLLYWLLAG
jgi:hypothetical protein